ncbi:MAG: hypothetical protein MJ078_02925, partial [Clostridia bacterium]|nr:hypothetical protein [Clostridia bacterium]
MGEIYETISSDSLASDCRYGDLRSGGSRYTEIRTEAALLDLFGNNTSASRVHAVLKEDITLNTTFEPCYFYGIFDGCGHTVTVGNNRVEKLFDTVAEGSTVINLNV